jgi:hypothetical protein
MHFFHAKHAKEIPCRARKAEKCISHRFTDYLKPAGPPFAPDSYRDLRLCGKQKESPADARRFTADNQSPEGFPFATFAKEIRPLCVKGILFFHAKHAKEIHRIDRKE